MPELDLGRVVGPGVPAGGSTGNILSKLSADDYDTGWETLSSIGQKLIEPSNPVGAALSQKATLLMNSLNLYVSNSGSDSTGDGTEANPYATIQRAINTIPQNLNGHVVTINVSAGTYTGFDIKNFYGGSGYQAGISILGEGVANQESNYVVISGGISIFGCAVPIYLTCLNITGNASGCNIIVNQCESVRVHTCKCSGQAAAVGIHIADSLASIYNCVADDKSTAGILANGSVVFASLIKGSNNAACFQAGSNNSGTSGLLIGDRHTITGTIKYAKERGGIVFSEGVQA